LNKEAVNVMRPDPPFGEVAVALLAGGLATRLRPITQTIPKAMVEVAGRPFIDHQLALLRRNGLTHVVLCLGHLGEQVAGHVGDGSRHGVHVQYSFDGAKLLGTGGALRRALPLLGEVFWILYGDSYLDFDYRAVWDAFHRSGAMGLMTVLRNANQWDKSNVIFEDGRLAVYDKRRPDPRMQHVDYGAALLRRAVLERLPTHQVWDLADLYRDLVAEGRMVGSEMARRFFEIGSPAGLAETQLYLQQIGLGEGMRAASA
jgi:NDP-sugar pyrophosphorylase family protein